MIVLIILFIILCLSFGIKVKLKISQEESIAIAVFGMTLFSYLLGLINLLGICTYLIGILSIVSLIYVIIQIKKKRVRIRELITLPTIIYCILIAFIYYIVKDFKFSEYDEFMFWGTNLKVMFQKSCLWANFSIDGIHLTYPPFVAITEYIFCKFYGEFNEGIAYFGLVTLIATSLIPLMKNEKYNIKSFLKIVLIIVITYIAIVLFNYNIANLSVDCILGIFFAVAMFLAYKLENSKDYIMLITLLIVITLIKTNGMLFAGIIIMELAIIEIFSLIKNKVKDKKYIAKKLGMILILLAIVITTYMSWKIYYTLNGKQVDDRHDQHHLENIDIQEFINAIMQNEKASDRNKQIVLNFIEGLLKRKITIKSNYYTFQCMLIAVDIMFVIYLLISKNKRKMLANFISINIGLVLYIISNLFLYMFVFQEYQGERLMSFGRYIGTYMLAMTLNLVYLILEKTEWKKIIFTIIIMFILQNGINKSKFKPAEGETISLITNQINTEENANEIKENVKETEKVYIIDQYADSGEEFMKTRYYIAPIKTNLLYEWCIRNSSIENYYEMQITEEDFLEKLIAEEYDYVYMIRIKENFLEEYGEIFSEKAKQELEGIIMENNQKMFYISDRLINGTLLRINKENKRIESVEENK